VSLICGADVASCYNATAYPFIREVVMSDTQQDHQQAYGEGLADAEAGKEDRTQSGSGVAETLVDAASGGMISLLDAVTPSHDSSTEDQSYQAGYRDGEQND
jgi:hypothetical protein